MNVRKVNKEKVHALIGERLRESRLRKDITGTEAASIFGVSKSAISRIESGENSATIFLIFRMCAYYEVDPSYILGFEDMPTFDKDLMTRLLKRVEE